MNDEIWKEIEGFEPRMISSTGRIRGVRGNLLSAQKEGHGYLMISMWSKTHKRRILNMVHHLVARAFIGPKPKGLFVLHKNDIPTDNRVENLRYGTRRDNAADAAANGKHYRGEQNRRAKLTDAAVRTARAMKLEGCSNAEIAGRFNVTPSIISDVLRGKRWRHVL